jgi:hypothetical protein
MGRVTGVRTPVDVWNALLAPSQNSSKYCDWAGADCVVPPGTGAAPRQDFKDQPMDIIILFLLVVTGGLMLRGAPRGLILTSWFITAVLILALFKHHATSALNLSF